MTLLLLLRSAAGSLANSVLPAISGTAQVGQTLAASTGTWTGGSTPYTYTYAWRRETGVGTGVYADIAGAVASTYSAATADLGRRLRVRVTARDAIGTQVSAESAVTAAVTAAGPPPVSNPKALPPRPIFQIDFPDDVLSLPFSGRVKLAAPLGYYRLQETSGTVLADASGHNHPGTLITIYSPAATLNLAGALSGDSASRSIDFGNNFMYAWGPTGMSLRGGQFSFVVWIFPTGTGVGGFWTHSIVGGSGDLVPSLVRQSNGTITLLDPNSTSRYGGYGGHAGQKITPLNQWSMVALTWTWDGSDGTWRLYVNGQADGFAPGITSNIYGDPISTNPFNGDQYRATSNLWIVGSKYGTKMPGRIAEPALFDRALNEGEIASMHASSITTPPPAEGALAWTAIQPRGFTISRGRAKNIDVMESGTGSVAVEDSSRALEPENEDSPYTPDVVPFRLARFRAQYPANGGSTYDLLRGFIPDFNPVATHRLAKFDLAVHDWRSAITRWPLTANVPSQKTGARINRILDLLGFDPTRRLIDEGQAMMAAKTIDATASSELDFTATTEEGIFFFNAAGYAVFHDRQHRATAARSITSQATFGNGPPPTSELPLVELTRDFSESWIINRVEVTYTPASGPAKEIVVSDYPSQNRNGIKSIPRSTGLLTEADARAHGQRILDQYAQPRLRYPTLVVDPSRHAALWLLVLSLEFGDRVTTVWRAPDQTKPGGFDNENPEYRDAFIERISHNAAEFTPMKWLVTFTLTTV